MRHPQIIPQKIVTLSELMRQVARLRLLGKTIAFTNGCFDILHKGHIASLSEAAAEADFLIVGVNSDASVGKLKGPGRPVNEEQSRATILAALLMIDAVVLFGEDTPLELIRTILPDVLVKGGDYTLEQIVGAKEVLEAGGRVVINPLVPGVSTTGLIEKIHRL
ncbi:MAG: D-glycero-beta-D-manno-heptose 1-phosphate adenylyltransferase [Bacteroidota bacterium]|nr:D-glycero-beta-D-manno-heptose 1-phosphate adenylyltransferase [Bacteroidota bacterium]MDP4214741.1 D-glycero-beta-D-manno-heptose 1-phosphate adenylyltransferase [Bacteroidota bacterium]MDP4253296.1 D-glycero-beta-D-manno-heptose 1-phosphate adenylyltransferase [Bacteroidota bacterium]